MSVEVLPGQMSCKLFLKKNNPHIFKQKYLTKYVTVRRKCHELHSKMALILVVLVSN